MLRVKNFFDKSLVTGHKRILQEYKTASRENRLKLLAGIIDTDGHKVPNANTIEITTKYQDLAEDYAFLCRSLGFRTSVSKKEHCKLNEKYYEAYTVRFSGELSSIPCKLKRKQSTESFKDGDPLKTSFKLENIGLGEYYGFTIDGDHLFMLGDFTVTHNTTDARIFAREIEPTIANIMEINCADHTGVDDVRDLVIEPSRTKPITGNYKIFILDECFAKGTSVYTKQGAKSIETIIPGEYVQHMNGFGKVTHVFKNTVKTENLFFIKINGKELITTKDHLFFKLKI